MYGELTEYQKQVLLEIDEGTQASLTKVDFSLAVEQYVDQTKCEYIEALLLLREMYDIPDEKMKNYLTDNLVEKLGVEQGIHPHETSLGQVL